MNKREFYKGLGLSLTDDKATEIVVLKDKIKMVAPEKETADEHDSDHEPSASDSELNELRSKVLEIEEKQKCYGQDVREKLNHNSSVLAKLQGQIKTGPAIIQGGQKKDIFEGLRSRLDNLEELWEAKFEDAKCPNCGRVVGWDALPAKWHNQFELKSCDQLSIFPWLFNRYGKRCRICNHFEQTKK